MFNFPKRAEIADSETLKINSDVIELRKQGKDVIPLVAGEPDFDTPKIIKEAPPQHLECWSLEKR